MERETAMKTLKELHGKSLFAERTALETIIPELKESEDEKIRKALVRFHKSTIDIDGIKGADILAWLEKQGEKKPVISDDALREGIAHFGITQYQIDNWLKKYVDIEKQGEQKTAVTDFNAKDWYVSKVDGKIHDMTYNPADKVEPKFKVKYAGSEYNVLEVKDIAGVTFYGIEDEPNHIDYVKAENCEIISGYAIKENGSPYPTKPAVFSEKKPTAWSDEDEANLNNIIMLCNNCINGSETTWIPSQATKIKHLIETIKERGLSQQKPTEWSDEDEEMLRSCTGAIWAADYYLYEDNQEMEAWLKRLKDRMGG